MKLRYLFILTVTAWLSFSFSPSFAEDLSSAELTTLAEKGDAASQYALGRMFQGGGHGVPQDYTQAVKWYRKSAEQGYAPAEIMLGSMYMRGVGGLPKDPVEARKWHFKAAEQGSTLAKISLFLDDSPTAAYFRSLPSGYGDTMFWIVVALSIIAILGFYLLLMGITLRFVTKRTAKIQLSLWKASKVAALCTAFWLVLFIFRATNIDGFNLFAGPLLLGLSYFLGKSIEDQQTGPIGYRNGALIVVASILGTILFFIVLDVVFNH